MAILHTEGWHWTRPVICGTPPVGRAGHSLVALSTPPAEHAPDEDENEEDEDEADHDDADDERHGQGEASGAASGGAGEVGREPCGHRQLGASLLLFGGRAAGDKPLDDLYELRPISSGQSASSSDS